MSCFLCVCSGECEIEHNAMDHLASIEVRLDTDGFERTRDGKFRCRFCNYASKGQARVIEHMRIHTGLNSFFFFPLKSVKNFTRLYVNFVLSIFLTFFLCVCVKERSLTVVSSVRSPRRTSDSWKHTCAHTRVRNRTSATSVRSAVTTGATCLTIAAADTNSAPCPTQLRHRPNRNR